MPTYEYICDACEHEFEEFQSITASALKKCPACGKLKLRRKIGTGGAIIFKGSGFYETDYRSDSYKKAEKAEKDAAKPASIESSTSKTDSSASKPTETKPAEKKPAKKESKASTKAKD